MTSEKSGESPLQRHSFLVCSPSLDALRDARILWPPDVVWGGLRNPQRLELGAGIALIVVTLVMTIARNWSV